MNDKLGIPGDTYFVHVQTDGAYRQGNQDPRIRKRSHVRVEKYYDSDAASLTLGCIILTGYLGGAVAAYTRMGGPYPILVPLSTAMIAWFGIWLRDECLRSAASGL